MNGNANQRKLYLLAALLLVVTVAMCLAWQMWTPETTNFPESSPAPFGETYLAGTPEPAAQSSPSPMVNTVVYYQDNSGYLVPVMRSIPETEGIAKATLSMMVQSPYNDMEAARLGLRTVLPENVTIDLDVLSDGTARIDLSKEVLNLADAAAESVMVSAVVQTLTEFSTIDRVEFLVGGQVAETLTHGTSISGSFERSALNPESSALAIEDAKMVTLYFPGDTGNLIVPVTRMVAGNADIDTAVLELLKGPSATSPLENALPTGCALLGITVDGKVATVNFTNDFIRLVEETDGGRMALRALVLTCTQFMGIEEVRIEVEGKPYDPGEDTLSVPTFVNIASDVEDQFLQTQASALFE
ncbi:MAG: hypothetical protein E7335_01875 [Clostridiales bacterium]|nr:hypothetical protein [Clostridiales bacterium]